jgi:hypothetical protein
VDLFCGLKLGALDYPNKFTIERKFPWQPANCVFKSLLNLQLWRPLQKAKDLPLLDVMEALIKNLFSSKYAPLCFLGLSISSNLHAVL